MSDEIARLNPALEGRYTIERELGRGGMATVYLARDLKHDREVALKVLKPELAAVVGAERFLAEIKTTANLQHPDILPLFDSGQVDGFLFYVMPYVRGESLRDRLDRDHQLPVDEAVRIARDVAEALDYAHRQGVVHRDIKPANILLQDDKPVVSDFGIALAVGTAGGGRLTETGLSLGTPHYMSPEQATGDQSVGPATDTYAIACVLYEMLVGEPPHTGGTAQAILGKIVTGDPDPVTAHRKAVPPNVDAAIRRALEKVPADRFPQTADFAEALSDPTFRHADDPSGGGGARAAIAGSPLPWIIAAVALIAATIGWGREVGSDGASRPPAAFIPVSLATSYVSLTKLVDRFAVSPTGDVIVYLSEDPVSGEEGLYIRRMGDLDPVPLPGGSSGMAPVFSPDGDWVAFSDGDRVVRVPVDGSAPPFELAAVQNARNLTWDREGWIGFTAASGRSPLIRVPASGGPADSLGFRGDTTVWRAESLDSERMLLSLGFADGTDRIVVREGDGGLRDVIRGRDARISPSGHLLYSRPAGDGWALAAAPFDRDDGVLTGPEFVLVDEIPLAYATPAAGTATGDLIYLDATPRTDRRILVLDRAGNLSPGGMEPDAWVALEMSSDGEGVVAVRWNGATRSIWVADLTVGTQSQVTFDGDRFGAIWSPDRRRIAFTYFPNSGVGVAATSMWSVDAEGRGEPEPVGDRLNAYPYSFSPDGATLYFHYQTGTATGTDIWAADVASPEREVRPVLATRADERAPRVSPDGRWLAFETDVSGGTELRIGRLPDLENSVQVTLGGGDAVGWQGDSSRFYYGDDTTVWEIEIGPDGPLPGSRTRAFTLPARTIDAGVTPDGQRLVVLTGGLLYSDLIVRQGVLDR